MVKESISPSVRKSPPGPRSYPVVGCLPQMLRNPVQFLTNAARQYGEVVHLGSMGPRQFYLVVDPDAMKYILQENNRNYIKGSNFKAIELIIGDGLAVKEGDAWRNQRRLMQPSFHRHRVAALVTDMTKIIAEMLESWRTQDADTPFDVSAQMMLLTQRILVKSLLSIDGGDVAAELLEAWNAVYTYLSDQLFAVFRLPVWIPTSGNRQFQQAMHTLDKVVYRVIQEHRQTTTPPDDILSMLMDVVDEESGERMSDRQLRDEIMTVFTGGFETSAGVLAWAWYLLSKHPSVERRLQAELADVLGGRIPTFEDLPKLKYTKMIIEETMRLYPGAWGFTRTNLDADEVSGYHIPANSLVMMSPYVVHRLPRLWENPEGFDPERFAPEKAASRSRNAYIPFGSGPRQCIGEIFAMVEMQLVLAMVAQQYRLHLVPGHPVEKEARFTLRARHGILMTLKPLSGSNKLHRLETHKALTT